MSSSDSREPHPDSEVALHDITEKTLRAILGLQVGEHQRTFVADKPGRSPKPIFRRTRGSERSTKMRRRWALSCCGMIRTNPSTPCGA